MQNHCTNRDATLLSPRTIATTVYRYPSTHGWQALPGNHRRNRLVGGQESGLVLWLMVENWVH